MILDVRMPGLNGLELQKRLMDRGETLPIIFLTAFEDPQARRAACSSAARSPSCRSPWMRRYCSRPSRQPMASGIETAPARLSGEEVPVWSIVLNF